MKVPIQNMTAQLAIKALIPPFLSMPFHPSEFLQGQARNV
jgi:hypothetical protein